MCDTLYFSLYPVSCPHTHTHSWPMHTHYLREEWVFRHKSAFCNLKTKLPFPIPCFFTVSDDKRLNRTGFTLVCQTIRDAMFQTCLVTAMQNQQHSIDLTRAAFTSQEIHFPQAPPRPQPIIYMRTITNEGVVERGPGTVVHLPRRGSHLAQVRWGSHIPATPCREKKNGSQERGKNLLDQ